jgi:methylated-DNA-[protein]-cysteine S-methyltransferase
MATDLHDHAVVDSPVGRLEITTRGDAVTGLRFVEPGTPLLAHPRPDHPALVALDQYFAGELDALASIRTELHGTPFQVEVWQALRAIPVGEVASYGEIAAVAGRPSAARAVGQANHVNPIALIVPCHRVIGANGTLTGYGGGLDRKRWLLAHEGAMLPV